MITTKIDCSIMSGRLHYWWVTSHLIIPMMMEITCIPWRPDGPHAKPGWFCIRLEETR